MDAGTQDADNDPGDVANAEMANDIDQNNGMGQIDDQDCLIFRVYEIIIYESSIMTYLILHDL